MELLRLEHITKNFGKGDGKVAALRDISLKIDEGELVAIIGKSGSGKSTLLNVIGSLMRSDGALDEENGRNVMKVLKELNESGKTVIIVTHDNKIAGQCNRIIEIRDGEIVDENKK